MTALALHLAGGDDLPALLERSALVTALALHLAGGDDLPALQRSTKRAITRLKSAFLTAAEVEASKALMGLDT